MAANHLGEDEEINYKERFELAATQRYMALKHAFDIIRPFAEHSLNPVRFGYFKEIEKDLLENYGADVPPSHRPLHKN